jgi:hybrid cluster-associated redox disulfide protein
MQITKDTSVDDVLKGYPTLTRVFIQFGLPCQVCGQAFWGTIEELAQQNNVNPENLVKKLNEKRHEIDEKI